MGFSLPNNITHHKNNEYQITYFQCTRHYYTSRPKQREEQRPTTNNFYTGRVVNWTVKDRQKKRANHLRACYIPLLPAGELEKKKKKSEPSGPQTTPPQCT